MSGHSAWQIFAWVGLPYLALGIFVVSHLWRRRYDQFSWTSRSTQLRERRLLRWGSPAFHYGTFAAIAEHVIGVLMPERWTRTIGIPETAYRWFSAAAGTLAAVLIIAGWSCWPGADCWCPGWGDYQPGRLARLVRRPGELSPGTPSSSTGDAPTRNATTEHERP